MEIVIKVAQLLLSLSILVILHELGHFLFAKLFKTRVEKFYLFFDPWFSLFKYKKGDTEYGIGWLPLGGYVKISGMIDESMDKEQLKQPAQPYEFRSKPTWQRLLIMIGGVLVNFLLAMVLYSMILYIWGEEYLPTQNAKYGIACDSTALKTGLRPGDMILSLDNQPVEDFNHIQGNILLNNVKTIQVQRDSQRLDIAIPRSIIPELIKDRGFIAPRMPFIVADFAKNSVGKKSGIRVSDKIIRINAMDVPYFDQFKKELGKNLNKPVTVGVVRGTDTLTLTVAAVPANGMLGIEAKVSELFQLKQLKYSFFGAIPAGIHKGFSTISSYLKQFRLLFDRSTKAYESLGGFISIGKIFPSVWNWESFWSLTAFLSIILAVMNILPIPALDGGHVMFLLYEIITGRSPGEKFLEYAQIVGMVILFSLLLFANGNDIFKLFK